MEDKIIEGYNEEKLIILERLNGMNDFGHKLYDDYIRRLDKIDTILITLINRKNGNKEMD